jgi:hypothetical protein
MRWSSVLTRQRVELARIALTLAVVCLASFGSIALSFAQQAVPQINQTEARALSTTPYSATIESRLTFLSGLYRQLPRLFVEGAKYDFDMLQILNDQSVLMTALNAEPEYQSAIQNRPPLSTITVTPLGNQGNRVQVPVRGALPLEAIQQFQVRLIAAAELIDAELSRTQRAWGSEAVAALILADYARLDPSKPNPGQIVAALQSLLPAPQKKEAAALKDFNAKIEYLARNVDPALVQDPAMLDPSRLRLSAVFSGTPTLAELIQYCTEYTKTKEALGDRLALFAQLSASSAPVASKEGMVESIAKMNHEQLVYLSDEGDILRPLLEKLGGSQTVSDQAMKSVLSVLGDVFAKAPTTLVDVSPVVLVEQPWWYGILRGFVSGDCSSQHSFAYPNDPGERTFFISDPGSPGDYKGIVTASSVVKGGKRSLYVITIHGPRLGPADAYSVIYGLDQIKGQLGYDAIELPVTENLKGLVNRDDLRAAMEAIASKGEVGSIRYENNRVREIIEKLKSDYNKGDYDRRAQNTQARRFSPDPQVTKGLAAQNAWATLQMVDASPPSKATALQMFRDVLYAKRHGYDSAQELLEIQLKEIGQRWGIEVEAVKELMEESQNPRRSPLNEFEATLSQRLTAILDTPSELPRGTETARSLIELRSDWFRHGFSVAPDLMSPENASRASRVFKDYASDLRVALKDGMVPAYLLNNSELLLAEQILSVLARDGLIQGKDFGPGLDIAAQHYRELLTGKAQKFGSDGVPLNEMRLRYYDHMGERIRYANPSVQRSPLPEGQQRAAVEGVLYRYEVDVIQRTRGWPEPARDILNTGRPEQFWNLFREAVRTWDTANVADAMKPQILDTAVRIFGKRFIPNYLELVPIVHAQGGDYRHSMVDFLKNERTFPPTLMDWYVNGFLQDFRKFPPEAFGNAQVPPSVWNKIQEIPRKWSEPFLAGQKTWPQPTLNWFLNGFGGEGFTSADDWRLLSVLYERGQATPAVIERAAALIASGEAFGQFVWNGTVPPQIQAGILQRAVKAVEETIPELIEDELRVEKLHRLGMALSAVAGYLADIPKGFYDRVLEVALQNKDLSVRERAVNFLNDTSERWPDSFKEAVLRSLAPSRSSGSTWGDLWNREGAFEKILDWVFRGPPGRDREIGLFEVKPKVNHQFVRVNVNASTFMALWKGYVSSVPDRFAIISTADVPNTGITLGLEVHNTIVRGEPNGYRTISAADLLITILKGNAIAKAWSVDPRHPASVGDMIALAEAHGVTAELGRETGDTGGRTIQELRRVLRENLKAPTTPGEVVVRGGPTFTAAVNEVVLRFGGRVYTEEGGRTRVVLGDGSVVEYPSVVPREYTSVIGDRVAFIEVVGGTATGAAAQAIAREVPADVYNEFNRLNPVAGNQFVEEGANQVIDRMVEGGKPPVIGGLPIEGLVDGQLAVGRRNTFESLRNAYYEAGWEANLKASQMINEATKWRKGFGVAGMIGSFIAVETANSVFEQQMDAIAAGNWDAFDASYRDAVNKLPETALHTAAGIAVFEGAGIGFGALSTAGAALAADGSVALGAVASGVGAGGSMLLSATGIGFVAVALAHEMNELGKAEELIAHLDAQAAQVGMTDDSWAYSDNPVYRQAQLESEFYVHALGGAWNAAKDWVGEAWDIARDGIKEAVNREMGSPDGKVWAFDSSFENGDIGADSAVPNPTSFGDLVNEWLDVLPYMGEALTPTKEDPLIKIPTWLEDLAAKGGMEAGRLSSLLRTVHDVFPSLVGAPTTRGSDILKAGVEKPALPDARSSRMPGVFERMEDAIRRMNQKAGAQTPPSDDIRFDDLVAELGTDPVAWSEAFEAGLISMADIERVFGRMKAAEPEDPNAPPPPQIVKAPSSAVVEKGKSVTLTVQATGQNLHYVWAHDGEPFVNLDGATLTISNADFDDAGSYVAYVSDGKTMVAAPPAQVSVVGFTDQPPATSSVLVGKGLSLSAQLSVGNATYQWMKNGAALAGATNPTLTVSSVKSSDAAVYTLVARIGGITVTSDPAAVNVLEFSKEPEFRVAAVGSRVTMPASAKLTLANGSSGTVTYQWLKGGVAMAGQTSAVLTIASAQKSDTSKYAVKITHGDTSIESASAHLEVIDRVQSAVSLSISPAYTCSIPQTTGGKVSCSQTVGTNKWGEVTPGNILGATSLGLGVRHGCAINALSKVVCWGDNAAGQTTPPTDLTGVVSLGMGVTYSCALLNTGLLRCWGGAVQPPGVNQVIALESSASGTCVKTWAGDRVCWGP